MKTKLVFLIILIAAILGVGSFLSYKTYRKQQDIIKEENLKKQALLEKRQKDWLSLKKTIESKVANFKGTVGIVVEDLDTGWEIAFNETTLIPSASLVKVPVMLSCFYAAQDGKTNLKDTIKLKSSQKVAASKALANKPAGSIFTVEELFDPMITQSDNTAANLVIDFMGFDTLNTYFKKMGLKDTNIVRKMMDFKKRKKGEENYTTAQDMAYLLEELYHKKFLNKYVSEKCLQLLGQQKINNRIPKKLPKGTYVVHKTGLEDYICHDMGIVFTDKGDFLICVLVKSKARPATSSKKLIADLTLLTYNYYQNLP